jgi:tetratricopeptide (TPR) repeat protein
MQRGDGTGALELFEKGLRLATENRDRYQEVRALQYIALAHLETGHPAETALEIARSSTEMARKVPMAVGITYGLAFQALALSRLGRHDEAVATSDEAIGQLDGARLDGVEHLFRWRAQVLQAAGKADAAREASARAAAEVESKAAKLRDPELREHYLASRQRTV